MNCSHFTRLLCTLALLSLLTSCNLPGYSEAINPIMEGEDDTDLSLVTPLPPLPETLISFRVQVPPDTATDETVYLSILDEVTGLALNAQLHPMEEAEASEVVSDTQTAKQYAITLPFAIGSVVKYRYERQAESIRVAEHLTDGSDVRYRMYHVTGQGTVEDVVSRWTDTTYSGPEGRITGVITDADTSEPIPNIFITAGGAQTTTKSDGSFLLEGLPPGTHNLVAYAMDGSYRTFQQGARVAPQRTTPAQVALESAPFVKVVFVVGVPDNTPPIVPLRLSGNLYQLGNTYANLTGGVSSLALNMPTLETLPDGRYKLTVDLPAGADIRYKYTLGDGFWNAERKANGEFQIRQIVVPDSTTLIEDHVESWYDGDPNQVTFDVYVPDETPQEEFVSIQFGPLFGWTEPIPMWDLGGNRWAYVLYSPLNLPGNLNYRYCRNDQCGYADDIQTPGLYGQGRPIIASPEPQTLQDSVSAWVNLSPEEIQAVIPESDTPVRGPGFWAGIEFVAQFHPSWMSLLPSALDKVQATGANWLVLSPTWTFGRAVPGNDPPILALNPGKDPMWFDVLNAVGLGNERGLDVALFPRPNFLVPTDEWWESAPREEDWWQTWFDQFRDFALHHADLANQSGASALILGGDWISPALPGGALSDGTPSGVPEDASDKWRDILAEVQSHFGGTLAWAIPHEAIQDNPPDFIDPVDQLYLLLSLSPEGEFNGVFSGEIEDWFNNTLLTYQVLAGKPLILGIEYPSSPDMQVQVDAYNVLLTAAARREWIDGFISRSFFPPVTLQDPSPSIRGKPASDLLNQRYPLIIAE